jgi:hypothetical protein
MVLEGRPEDAFELKNLELFACRAPCISRSMDLRMDQAIRLSKAGALARTETPEFS